MGPLAARLLLESLLAPFLFAALTTLSIRGLLREAFACLVPAFAMFSAVGITYILAFGWPPSLTMDARMKVMLSAVVGMAVGMALHHRIRGANAGLAIATIGVPLWIGLPSLLLGKPTSALLLLPLAAAALGRSILGDATTRSGSVSRILILLTLAIGLAAIAAFAKAFSFAELGLALASALLAILVTCREPFQMPATLTAAAMLLALATALLLYSGASLPAFAVLAFVLGADRLARASNGNLDAPAPIGRVLFFCLVPAAAAIAIARIDAGPISIY